MMTAFGPDQPFPSVPPDNGGVTVFRERPPLVRVAGSFARKRTLLLNGRTLAKFAATCAAGGASWGVKVSGGRRMELFPSPHPILRPSLI
jgi:hypothetical protein